MHYRNLLLGLDLLPPEFGSYVERAAWAQPPNHRSDPHAHVVLPILLPPHSPHHLRPGSPPTSSEPSEVTRVRWVQFSLRRQTVGNSHTSTLTAFRLAIRIFSFSASLFSATLAISFALSDSLIASASANFSANLTFSPLMLHPWA